MSLRATFAALLAAGALATLAAAPGAATGATPRASLTDIENDVMCVACHEPLAVAESPQAYAERDYVRMLIAQGETKSQIEQALVAQYGPSVLGRPPASGFNLTVYVLPPAILALGILALIITLPKWRKRARTLGPWRTQADGQLDPADARRLDEDLAHFSG